MRLGRKAAALAAIHAGALSVLGAGGALAQEHEHARPQDAKAYPQGMHALSSVIVSPARVESGGSATGRVTLRGKAPKGGVPVALTTPDWLAVSLPQGVVVPEGLSSATFAVAAKEVEGPVEASVVASSGDQRLSAPLSVVPPLVSVSFLAPSVPSGGLTAGVVRLGLPAPFEGRVVTLSSPSGPVAPASVRVPAGATAATFPVRALGPSTLRLTASVGRVSQAGTLRLTAAPAPASLTASRANVVVGRGLELRVALNAPAPPAGLEVPLAQEPPGTLEVPPSVRVEAGERAAAFEVRGRRARGKAVVVAGSGEAAVRSPELHVTRNVILDSLALERGMSTGESSIEGVLRLSGPAPPGFLVALRGSSADVEVPARVSVPRGETSARFSLEARPVKAPAHVTITASQSKARRAATLELVPGVLPVELSFPAAELRVGEPRTGRLRLSGKAPENGIAVFLVASEEGRLRLPRTVNVAAGQVEAAVTVERLAEPVSLVRLAAPSVLVQASYAGTWVEAALELPPEPLSTPAAVAATPAGTPTPTSTPTSTPAPEATPTRTPTPTGTPASGNVAERSPASASSPSPVAAPPVPANARDWKKAGDVRLLAVEVEPGELRSGGVLGGTVTLSAPAGEGGAMVSLVASRPALLEVPATVLVSPGSSTGSFVVRAGKVPEETSVALSASYAGVIRFARVRLKP